MQIRRAGVHTVRKKLADGSVKTYSYAWRGGPAIAAAPGTKEFAREYLRLTKDRDEKLAAERRTLKWLFREYRKSPAFTGLRAVTRSDYERHILEIETEFHDLPLSAISETGMRSEFLAFRDRYKDTPRRADLMMAVLRRAISFAMDRELVTRNPLDRLEELAKGTRSESIWSDGQMSAFLAVAPAYMRRALMLAAWTGQRQGDLLRLKWDAYDGTHIYLVQSKTGRHVRVKVSGELKPILDAARAENAKRSVPSTTILTNGSGLPWRSGFKSQWRKTVEKAKVSGVTFHDLRGTFCTLAYRAGSSFKEIAEVSGHSEMEAERIIRRHYLAGDSAVEKIEAGTRSVKSGDRV